MEAQPAPHTPSLQDCCAETACRAQWKVRAPGMLSEARLKLTQIYHRVENSIAKARVQGIRALPLRLRSDGNTSTGLQPKVCNRRARGAAAVTKAQSVAVPVGRYPSPVQAALNSLRKSTFHEGTVPGGVVSRQRAALTEWSPHHSAAVIIIRQPFESRRSRSSRHRSGVVRIERHRQSQIPSARGQATHSRPQSDTGGRLLVPRLLGARPARLHPGGAHRSGFALAAPYMSLVDTKSLLRGEGRPSRQTGVPVRAFGL